MATVGVGGLIQSNSDTHWAHGPQHQVVTCLPCVVLQAATVNLSETVVSIPTAIHNAQ